MAWVATDNFESYSNGSSLSGASGGSGWSTNWSIVGTWTAQNSVVYEGSIAATCSSHADSDSLKRTFSAVNAGTFRYAIRLAGLPLLSNSFYILLQVGSSTRWQIVFGASTMVIRDGDGNGSQTITNVSVDTWYEVWVDFDNTANTARAKLLGGTYTSNVTGTNSGDIDTFSLNVNGATVGTGYFDYIGPTTVAAAPTGSFLLNMV